MAKKFTNTGISTGLTVKASQVSQSFDAFTGAQDYDIIISGSLNLTGSFENTGSFETTGSFENTGSFGNTGLFSNTGSFENTGSLTSTGSFSLSGSSNLDGDVIITGSTRQTEEIWTDSFVSASQFRGTASWATNVVNQDDNDWYNGTTYLSSSLPLSITGSILVTGSDTKISHSNFDSRNSSEELILSYNGFKRLRTQLDGIDVTGQITSSTNIKAGGTITANNLVSDANLEVGGNTTLGSSTSDETEVIGLLKVTASIQPMQVSGSLEVDGPISVSNAGGLQTVFTGNDINFDRNNTSYIHNLNTGDGSRISLGLDTGTSANSHILISGSESLTGEQVWIPNGPLRLDNGNLVNIATPSVYQIIGNDSNFDTVGGMQIYDLKFPVLVTNTSTTDQTLINFSPVDGLFGVDSTGEGWGCWIEVHITMTQNLANVYGGSTATAAWKSEAYFASNGGGTGGSNEVFQVGSTVTRAFSQIPTSIGVGISRSGNNNKLINVTVSPATTTSLRWTGMARCWLTKLTNA